MARGGGVRTDRCRPLPPTRPRAREPQARGVKCAALPLASALLQHSDAWVSTPGFCFLVIALSPFD